LQLTTEPLRIDCVVIKKTKEVEIKKNIGKIFKTWNLFEYKNPQDYVSIGDFYKVYGYACIYASLNEIPITDITITFVESHYPRELIKHLKNVRGYTVVKIDAGIYTIVEDIIPIQIIDSRKLSAEDNVWLKNLSNDLSYSDVELITMKIVQQGKTARIAAYTYAVVYGNFSKIKENDMTAVEIYGYDPKFEIDPKFEQMLEEAGYIPKWKIKECIKIIADKDAKLADKDTEIERLRAQLAFQSKR